MQFGVQRESHSHLSVPDFDSNIVSCHLSFMPAETPTRTLRVFSPDGLCNRLMVLLSGRVIAEASQRAFSMAWVPANTCNCPYDLLFENSQEMNLYDKANAQAWRDLRDTPEGRFPNLVASRAQHLQIRYHYWLLKPKTFPDHTPLFARTVELFQALQPVSSIATRIDAFQAEYFRPTMIGVHLRRGDYFVGRPDRVNNLTSAQAVVDRWLDTAPDAGILLCTDDGAPLPHTQSRGPYQGVREEFRQRYGTRVVIPAPRSLDRATPEAIQDAVIELWLLRRTQFFVGTTESTFSELAALGRDIATVTTHGPTQDYEKRLEIYKRAGVYRMLMALARLEFGTETSYFFISNLYKARSARIKNALRGKWR